ncbi:unnamed protein product, partial [Mesorhabditis belari]|uniref:Uncharacterized protein n=1 Tax=Mesorhabditis belari TaxID=2138241 RepID=A0AAF3J282_9BILA
MTNDWVGTPSHMAPELHMDMSLSEQDIYQCDVFATGLVLWEIAMRKSISNLRSVLHFSKTTSSDVRKVFDFIERCSSPQIPIKIRMTAENALNEAVSLEKKFTSFISQPEKVRSQESFKVPTIVDGLCLELTTTYNVPDAIFDFETRNSERNSKINSCNYCITEFIGLTYIRIGELGDTLRIMQRHLRKYWNSMQNFMMPPLINFLSDCAKGYKKEMQMAMKEFWEIH